MKTVTKDKILHRAAPLFFAEGFATGIDRVTRECDTAKMTIYSEFKSKDGLICAILDEVRRSLAERIRQVIEPALPPTTRLRAVFNLVCYGMHDPELRLGLGVRALTEFPSPSHPVHQSALDVDRSIPRHLQPDEMAATSQQARQLLLLAKGCFLMAPLVGIQESRALAAGLALRSFNRRGDGYRVAFGEGRDADP